jgi:hypothetical protein
MPREVVRAGTIVRTPHHEDTIVIFFGLVVALVGLAGFLSSLAFG